MSKKYDRHSYHRTGVSNLWSGGHFSCLFPHFFLCFPINTVYFLGNKRVVLEFYIIYKFNKNKTKQRATNFSKLYPK